MSYAKAENGHRKLRSSGDDQGLLRYWMVIRERIWVIIACAVLVTAAAGAYVKLAPRSYQATSEIEVQAASSNNAVLAALPVLQASGNPTQDVLTAASLVTIQPVAAAVVRAMHLDMSPANALKAVSASPVGQAGLVAVQATASTPKLAQQLANGFVDETIRLSTARMHAAIAAELPALENELAVVPPSQRYGPGSLGQQVDELRQLLHQSDPTLTAVAPATLPTSPSSPKTKLSLVAGLIGGLLVGIGAAFLLHVLDPRIRREEQLRERLGLLVLARIPRQPKSRPRPLLPSELSLPAQEGYHTLRTVLAARGRSAESRAILVTGSAPGEGKSTTAMGLAAALAQAGSRVILIEADLRRPTFSTAFNLAEFNGIERVLLGQVELSKAVIPVRVDGARFRVLAAHPGDGKSVGLSFASVRKLIADAKAIADFVVVDSAPLTAVIDALPFAKASDEVVVVARLDHTRIGKLEELDDLLVQNGVTQTGVVLIGDHPINSLQQYYYAETNGAGTASVARLSARSGRVRVGNDPHQR